MKGKIDTYVGKKGTVNLGGLMVEVEIIDVKNSYGRERYQIKPTAGKGQIWVENIVISK